MRTIGLVCGIALFVLGCSSDDDGDDGGGNDVTIAEGPLSGTVGGQDWTLARAETDAFLSEGEPDYWSDLYGTPRNRVRVEHARRRAPRDFAGTASAG